MRNQSQIFWDVDTQVDFMVPGGKLYVPGAETIVPTLQRLTAWAAEQGVLVVASTDAHSASDEEFAQWPPHCLVGTHGQQKIPETVLPRQYVVPNEKTEIPADLSSWQQVIVEKQQLDVFTNPNTERLVQQMGNPHVVLYGVVTELCVGLAARNLLRQGCGVTLVEDATAALETAKAQSLVYELVRQGVKVASASEVMEP